MIKISKLKGEEIDYIVKTYKEVNSIAKTAEITGFSKGAINNYVRSISSTKKVSRDYKNKIKQFNAKTGEFIRDWSRPAQASKELNIDPALISMCLSRKLKQTHGYIFIYSEENDK